MAQHKWFTVVADLTGPGVLALISKAKVIKLFLRNHITLDEENVGIDVDAIIYYSKDDPRPLKAIILRKLSEETSFSAIATIDLTGQTYPDVDDIVTENISYLDDKLIAGQIYDYKVTLLGENDQPTILKDSVNNEQIFSSVVSLMAANVTNLKSYLIKINNPETFGINGIKLPLSNFTNNDFAPNTGELYENGFRDIINLSSTGEINLTLINILNYKLGTILRKKKLSTAKIIGGEIVDNYLKISSSRTNLVDGSYSIKATISAGNSLKSLDGDIILNDGDALSIKIKDNVRSIKEYIGIVCNLNETSLKLSPLVPLSTTFDVILINTVDPLNFIENTDGSITINKIEFDVINLNEINLLDVPEIEDYYFEVHYTVSNLIIDNKPNGIPDGIIDDSDEDTDYASDENPEDNRYQFILAYRGKSITPIIELPLEYGRIKGFSASLFVIWKKSEIAETINIVNSLKFQDSDIINLKIDSAAVTYALMNSNENMISKYFDILEDDLAKIKKLNTAYTNPLKAKQLLGEIK